MRRRGFTMIELTITIAISAVVLGVMTMLFGFASVRLSDTYTKSALYDQMNGVADRLEQTIRNADSCTTRDSNATLVCAMPKNGVDTDGDGHADSYYPDKVDSNGVEDYTVGSYVWFYSAGPSGTYSVGSGNVWRAEQTSITVITVSSIDTSFAYYFGSNLRYPLVTSLSFSVNTALHTVTYTVVGSTRMGAETSTNTADSGASRTVSITRTVEWRN